MFGVSHPLQTTDSQDAEVQTAQPAYPLKEKSKCKNDRERILRVALFKPLAASARAQVLLKDPLCLSAVAAGDLFAARSDWNPRYPLLHVQQPYTLLRGH